jgi:hypothetical protein
VHEGHFGECVMDLPPCVLRGVKGVLVLLRQCEKGKDDIVFWVTKGLRNISFANSVQR